MDTYKPSPRRTLTAGLRATWNTNPVNQQPLRAPRRLVPRHGHDAAQPLTRPSRPTSATPFPATPLFSWQPRASLAYKLSNTMALHAGVGVFNDIIPAQVADLGATNPPYAPVFVGGINGQVGGVGIAPGVPDSAVDATARPTALPVRLPLQTRPARHAQPTCPLAVNLNTFPTGTLKTPYFLQWNLGIERELGAHGSLRVDYVGTRAVQEPYQVQLNGYQTVCAGCFAPFAYNQPPDQRFGNVNEFRTGAGSNYAGLQTSRTKQFAGLTLRANYTFSHCLDEVSNGGLLPFSILGILSPLPGELRNEYGNCDYDVRHNLSAFGMYEIPFHSSHALLRRTLRRLAGLRDRLPAQRPSLQRSQRTLHRQRPRHLPGQRAAVRQPRPRRPALPQDLRPRRHPARHPAVAQPGRLRLRRRSQHRRLRRRQLAANCQFGDSGRNTLRGPHFTYSEIYLTKKIPSRARHLPLRHPDVQRLQPSQLRPAHRSGRHSRQPATQTGFGALTSTISPPTGLLGVGLGGDSSPRMIAFQGRIEF